MTTLATAHAVRVCSLTDLEVERGRAALIGDTQIALFLLADGGVRAVQNLDPFSGAQVISRGIVGTRGAVPTIASPMHKQVFDLDTGACLDTQGKQQAALRTWGTEVRDGEVLIVIRTEADTGCHDDRDGERP